ncbi:hypothetical protein ACT2FY_01105 [Paraburkholderia fungorum]|uniref:hypothetical protein n=1 Tax=Paraburkholderia fungorum TaxID=134537 RepID=UPI00402B6B9A
MRTILGIFIILGISQACLAGNSLNLATTYLSERLVYVNGELVGFYQACIHDSNDVYLPNAFFMQVRLRRSVEHVECSGKNFWKPSVPFVRNDAKDMLSASVQATDYAPDVETLSENHADTQVYSNQQPNVITDASVLQHQLGLWRNPAGSIDATLQVSAREYSSVGLFSLEGYASSNAGRFQSYVSDASWKKNDPQLGIVSRIGVNTFSSGGSTTTLYGLVVGTDGESNATSTSQFLDGFADVPGRIQIRSAGTLIKEVVVSAGYFQIPASGLPVNAGSPGQYTLSLVDDSGRIVRTWDVFIPVRGQLLRQGTSTWKVFSGQVENNQVPNSTFSGPLNLGVGFVYRRGINSQLTAEVSAIGGQRSSGVGASADFVPTSWVSFNGGATKHWGDVLSSTAFAGIDLHANNVGIYSGYTRQSCYAQYLGANVNGQCENLRASLYAALPAAGRISLLRTATIGNSPKASSLGLNWTPPSVGRVSLSAYATRQIYNNSQFNSFGVLTTIPLDRAQITSTTNFAGSDTQSYSTSYVTSDAANNQYQLGADVNHNPIGMTGDLRGSAQFTPWFGSYLVSAQVSNVGQVTAGLSESGAVVLTHGQAMFTRQSDSGFAIVHLPELGGLTLEDGVGFPKAVTTHDGYAVVPASRGELPLLKVSVDELPGDVDIGDPLVGRIADDWTATLWEHNVRRVNHGWVRLQWMDGTPLPVGSVVLLGEGEPTYVLDDGTVFIRDFPVGLSEAEVRLPGARGRCSVKFPSSLILKQAYMQDTPKIVCGL